MSRKWVREGPGGGGGPRPGFANGPKTKSAAGSLEAGHYPLAAGRALAPACGGIARRHRRRSLLGTRLATGVGADKETQKAHCGFLVALIARETFDL